MPQNHSVIPKVSVVIPTYNRSRFLKAAVGSVLAQTFQDFEIVIVDDASTDDTPTVAEGFGDPRIQYVRHETNRRISGARNSGVKHSRGEYIAFLDDDDEWHPTKLGKQVRILDESAATVGAVYTAFERVLSATGEVVGVITPAKRGHILHELCSRNWIGTASTVCLRRRCFEEVGVFDESVAFGEEYDMWIRVSHRFDFRYLGEPLVRYGLHERRLSRNYDVIMNGLNRQLSKYEAYFKADPLNLSRRYISLGILYCYSGNSGKGREAFWNAIRFWPFAPKHYLHFALSLLGARAFRMIRRPQGLQ